MATMFQRAAAMLNRRMKQTQGVSVVYTRASVGQGVALTAWVGRTEASSENAGGPAVEYGDRDYLIAVADLVLGGAATEPKDADRVTEVIDGVPVVFQVSRPSNGEPSWRHSDPQRTVYRLHTKRVE
jgi:hypothetical protein